MKQAVSQSARQLQKSASISIKCCLSARNFASSTTQDKSTENKHIQKDSKKLAETPSEPKKPRKAIAELDEEMRLAMEGMAGDGGEAGLELEDGKATSMKRSVRENMFRYI
jgi:hypothetical protein